MFRFGARWVALCNGCPTFWRFWSTDKYRPLIYIGERKQQKRHIEVCVGCHWTALTITPRCLSAVLWWHHSSKLISAPEPFSLFPSVSPCCISFDNTTFIISTGSICAIMLFLPPLHTVKTWRHTSAEACVAWIIEDISSHELISAARGWATPESCVDKRSAVWCTYYRLLVI